MNNKTCGECWWFFRETGSCMHSFKPKHCSSTHSCGAFQPRKEAITKGDKIRQCGNRELAEMSIYEDTMSDGVIVYRSTLIVDTFFLTKNCAVSIVEAYLNAPAESEGEDE